MRLQLIAGSSQALAGEHASSDGREAKLSTVAEPPGRYWLQGLVLVEVAHVDEHENGPSMAATNKASPAKADHVGWDSWAIAFEKLTST